jgi:hypothetical protein
VPDYFTLAELRALPDVSDSTRYTDARVEAVAAYIVSVIEREVGTSFIARTVTDEVHDGGRAAIVLDKPHVLTVTSATVNGVALTTDLRARDGVLRQYADATSFTPIAFAAGSGNVKVTYSAGYSSTVPGDIKEAALQATRARLLETDSKATVNDRTSSITNEVGGTTQFVLPGEDRPTGYPAVDAVIIAWRDRLDNFGFA